MEINKSHDVPHSWKCGLEFVLDHYTIPATSLEVKGLEWRKLSFFEKPTMGKIFLISGVFILREIGLLTEVIGTPLEVSQEMIKSSLP